MKIIQKQKGEFDISMSYSDDPNDLLPLWVDCIFDTTVDTVESVSKRHPNHVYRMIEVLDEPTGKD